MPQGLRKLDDKVLGAKGDGGSPHDDARDSAQPEHEPEREGTSRTVRRTEPRPASAGNGNGLPSFLAVFWRVSRLVLLALGLVVLLAAALILLPANEDNVLVRNVLSFAETAAGPFKDVFDVEDPDRMRVYNYALAAAVYFILAAVVGKLPTGSKKKG